MTTISSECSTQWFTLFFHVWMVIASTVIVLAWLKDTERKKKSEDRQFARLGDLPVWYLSDTSSKLMVPLPMEALSNAWYGSWRLWTNLTETFRACHCALLVWPPFFFPGHPYIWRTTVRHDIYTDNPHNSLVPTLGTRLPSQQIHLSLIF